MDWNPDPHSLLTVRAGTDTGTPALREACRERYIASLEVCEQEVYGMIIFFKNKRLVKL